MDRQSTFPHIIGTEIENSLFDSSHKLDATIVTNAMIKRSWPYGIWASGSVHGTNGSRAYIDVETIIEYAGPECTNGFDAMLYELAGSLFWSRLFRGCDRALGRNPQAWLVKTNTSAHGASRGGHHINFSMPKGTQNYTENHLATIYQLKALVVSLQLICGAGIVLPREQAVTRLGTPAYGYAISGRGIHVNKDFGEAYSKNDDSGKPLFLKRDEPLADKSRFWRLQICGLDSNILPEAIRLKLDILLIMVELAAMGAIDPVVLIEDLQVGHTTRRVSLDWREPLATESHGSLTPLQIQWHYFRIANDYVIKYRDGRGADILDQWARILVAFDTKEDVPAALNGKVDWVTKALMLHRAASKSGHPLSCNAAEDAHFKYHSYRFDSNGTCLPVLLAYRYGPPNLTRQVLRAMRTPPSDTRAWARGAFVGYGPKEDLSVNWEFFGAKNTPRFKMPDPSVPTTQQFEEFRRYLYNNS